MAKRRLAALFLALGILIVAPAIALAATTYNGSAGLVPCGATSSFNVAIATNCQACNIVQLIQELITFLIGLAIPISMAMFAYAGFLYFTSGVGGSENISKAKNIFKNVLIGFVLALCSWLIVNTILYTVLSSTYFQGSSWFQVKCETRDAGTDPNKDNIGALLNSHLGIAPSVPLNTQPTCSSGTLQQDEKGHEGCYDTSGNLVATPTVGTAVDQVGVGNCSPSSLAGDWGSSANAMSCIAQQESACGANALSKTDRTTEGQAVSVGLYQINLSANNVLCGSTKLECPKAFTAPLTGSNNKLSIVNTRLYDDCVQAALTNSCNTQTAQYLLNNTNLGIHNWSTASKCGY